ncbi:hypothetical protein MN608_06706 [Microdochium nivale]|nr:hypothetical protein MN608_06706 [Microdochium nivale]
MKFTTSFITKAVLAAVLTTATAKPIAAAGKLTPRAECVSVEQIEKWMQDSGYSGMPTAFWAAGATPDDAERMAGHIGGVYYASVFDGQQGIWEADCTEADRLEDRMSEALAKQASGTAYVVLGNQPIRGGTWREIEYPQLEGTPVAVNRIDLNDQQTYEAHENPWEG